MTDKELFQKLASQNIRIFMLKLGHGLKDQHYFIHGSKTTAEWRNDIRAIRDQIELVPVTDEEGYATDGIFNGIFNHLHTLGYSELMDVVSDVFEGRVAVLKVKLVADPVHDIQTDGFGHFGWENRG